MRAVGRSGVACGMHAHFYAYFCTATSGHGWMEHSAAQPWSRESRAVRPKPPGSPLPASCCDGVGCMLERGSSDVTRLGCDWQSPGFGLLRARSLIWQLVA